MEWHTERAESEDGGRLIISFDNEQERNQFMTAVKTAITASTDEDIEIKRKYGFLDIVPEEENIFYTDADIIESDLFDKDRAEFAMNLRYYIAMLNEKTKQGIPDEFSVSEIRNYAKAIYEEFEELSKKFSEFKKQCRSLFESQQFEQKRAVDKLTKVKSMLSQYESIVMTHADNAYLPREYKKIDETLTEYYNLSWRKKINKLRLIRESRQKLLDKGELPNSEMFEDEDVAGKRWFD